MRVEMKIIVLIKQVPNTVLVRLDKNGSIIRDGVESILNPNDAEALEAALRVKDSVPGTSITLVSMGPAKAMEVLREGLAMGADDAVLLCDPLFAGSDTWATSNVIAAAIRRLSPDMVFCGTSTLDGGTSQVGPETAEKLGIPQMTYVLSFEAGPDTVIATLEMDDRCEIVSSQYPCLLAIAPKLFAPRYMTMRGIYDAYEREISVWSHEELQINEVLAGSKASPTIVYRSFPPTPKEKCVILEGNSADTASELIQKLSEKHFI